MAEVNAATGEVGEAVGEMDLVPLNLAGMSEEELLEMFPTPVQAAGALLKARAIAARAPAALSQYRNNLLKAERDLKVATALVVRDLAAEFPRSTVTERKLLAALEEKVAKAQEARDDAHLYFEYARDYDRAIGRDIDILRSLNANFREEHRS